MKLHVSWSFKCWELFAVFCELFTSFGDTGKRSFGGRTNKVSNFLLTLYGCSDRRTYNKNKTPSALRTKLIRYTIKKTTLDCNESEYEKKIRQKVRWKISSQLQLSMINRQRRVKMLLKWFLLRILGRLWYQMNRRRVDEEIAVQKIYKQTAQTSDESSSKT